MAKISCCTSFFSFSRWFSSLRKQKHQQGNKEKQSPQSSAALSVWLPQKSLAPPIAREVSSPAALALSYLNWVLADLSSSVPFSGHTRWIGMSPRLPHRSQQSRSHVVADALEPGKKMSITIHGINQRGKSIISTFVLAVSFTQTSNSWRSSSHRLLWINAKTLMQPLTFCLLPQCWKAYHLSVLHNSSVLLS